MAVIMHRDFRDGVTGSLLTYESAFRAELRSCLCLGGWPWPEADEAARSMVGEAERLIRATRPSWADGQHAATGLQVKDVVCRQCEVPLRAHQVHFCSRKCAHAWHREFNAEAA